jgi:hypothetical protein
MMSIAFTKKVVTKGMMSVSQGQWVAIAIMKATVDIKNNIQYKPLDFFSMPESLLQK